MEKSGDDLWVSCVESGCHHEYNWVQILPHDNQEPKKKVIILTTTKKQIPEDEKKIRVLQSSLAKDTKANKAWTMILQDRKEFAGIDKLEEKLKLLRTEGRSRSRLQTWCMA